MSPLFALLFAAGLAHSALAIHLVLKHFDRDSDRVVLIPAAIFFPLSAWLYIGSQVAA